MIEAKTLKPLWYDGKPTAVGSVINLTDSDFSYLASIGRVERIEERRTKPSPGVTRRVRHRTEFVMPKRVLAVAAPRVLHRRTHARQPFPLHVLNALVAGEAMLPTSCPRILHDGRLVFVVAAIDRT